MINNIVAKYKIQGSVVSKKYCAVVGLAIWSITTFVGCASPTIYEGSMDIPVSSQDLDGDGDIDKVTVYWFPQYEHIDAVISLDTGDDNEIIHTTNRTYTQGIDQWLSGFNGDEWFCLYKRGNDGRLYPHFEMPFAFYDPDKDGYSEIVIRAFAPSNVEVPSPITSIRYSYDFDNDAGGNNKYDYDFSFNLEGVLNEWGAQPVLGFDEIEEVEARACISWENLPELIHNTDWNSNTLIWAEAGTTADIYHGDYHERWEGVGGYALPVNNFRREYDTDYSGGLQLYKGYVSSVYESRVVYHLFGAEVGFLTTDYNWDGVIEHEYKWRDTDGDGYFDVVCTDGDCMPYYPSGALIDMSKYKHMYPLTAIVASQQSPTPHWARPVEGE